MLYIYYLDFYCFFLIGLSVGASCQVIFVNEKLLTGESIKNAPIRIKSIKVNVDVGQIEIKPNMF